uniref:Uncharacterized protein n=1 Tax=Brassica oleracea var. oleracea TaxID=109376 RepID=A0A0D3BKH6_BRAOL
MVVGPKFVVKSYPRFCTRGYAFTTQKRRRSSTTYDAGVCSASGDDVYYGHIRGILEIKYLGMVGLRCTVFYCDWHDNSLDRGVRTDAFGVTSVLMMIRPGLDSVVVVVVQGASLGIPVIFRIPLRPTAPTIHLPLLHALLLLSLPLLHPLLLLRSVPKKKGRLVGLGRRTRSVPLSSAPPPYVDPEILTAQLKDKDDRISLLETQMAAQQAGYEAQRRLNQQMMEMMQRMYPNEVFPDVPDP